jgi:hypothetical protein
LGGFSQGLRKIRQTCAKLPSFGKRQNTRRAEVKNFSFEAKPILFLWKDVPHRYPSCREFENFLERVMRTLIGLVFCFTGTTLVRRFSLSCRQA